MIAPLRVLIVEDSEGDTELLLRQLQRGGYNPIFERVDTPVAMIAAIDKQPWDIVISDYVMPRFNALSVLALLKEKEIDLPVIILSGKIGEDIAVEAMKAGAADYISKTNMARLVPAIQREIREAGVRRERKQLADQLLRSQRLEIAGRIAGQVAHDFNNLLAPLVGYAQLIKRQLPADYPATKYCDVMVAAAKRMAAINEDLLTLARRGHFEQEPIDLNRLVEQSIAQMLERPSTLTVEMDIAEDPLYIGGSEAQLMRVISNLLSNARDAMRDAGLLRLKTARVQIDKPSGQYYRIEAGEYARLDVSDSGCGIPKEIRDKIFDPFFTTKRTDHQRGSGLGLSVVQAIVSDHRGYVDLQSEVDKGTTISIYLPLSRETPKEKRAEEIKGGNESILIVDDDEIQTGLAKELLEPLGYKVTVMRGGEEATSYLRQHPIDLLVLDMVMADGIDGTETYRRAVEVCPGQKAIIVSGFAETERVRKAKELGVVTYLRKPVTMEELARAVREELDR